MTHFDKQHIALRYWLLGAGYTRALRAMEFAQRYHNGTRKDGAPEFSHQIAIASFVRTLPGLIYTEDTLATVMLHDTVEDFGVSVDQIRDLFGDRVAEATWAVTKKMPVIHAGQKVGKVERDEDELYAEMANDPIASIVKPADRMHNQSTMVGAFGLEKRASYVDFTDRLILPMMKIARRRHPEQEPAYMILQAALLTQARIVRGLDQPLAA